MAKVEHEEVRALRADWLQHQFTQSQIPALRKELDTRLKMFMASAEASTDPKVAHAYRQFQQTFVLLSVFTKGTQEGKTLAELITGGTEP